MTEYKMLEDVFIVKPCKTKASYEIVPKKNFKVDFSCVDSLANDYLKIVAPTPFVYAVRFRSVEMNLFSSGKIIVKEIEDQEEAASFGLKLLEVIKDCF